MELVSKKTMQLFSGSAHPELADEIAKHLNEHIGEANLRRFANGEMHARFNESVRGKEVFIIQSHSTPVNDAIMEQLIMIDAARRATAKRIIAVCPFFGYSRQDRKAEGREPITAKLVANMLMRAGAQQVMSIDLHSGQIQGFFDNPVDHLTAMPVLIDYVRAHEEFNPVIVAPDAGRVKVAEKFSQYLNADLAFVNKRRPKGMANTVIAREVIGEVEGRNCIVIDDMIDTAGTIVAASESLLNAGATDVWAMATHGLFSDPAKQRLTDSPISKIIVTNTLPLPEEKRFDKLEVLSVAKIIADAIDAVFEDTSVSEIFGGDNQG
jgi:ribose-phosphate pyrophosphokinase